MAVLEKNSFVSCLWLHATFEKHLSWWRFSFLKRTCCISLLETNSLKFKLNSVSVCHQPLLRGVTGYFPETKVKRKEELWRVDLFTEGTLPLSARLSFPPLWNYPVFFFSFHFVKENVITEVRAARLLPNTLIKITSERPNSLLLICNGFI